MPDPQQAIEYVLATKVSFVSVHFAYLYRKLIPVSIFPWSLIASLILEILLSHFSALAQWDALVFTVVYSDLSRVGHLVLIPTVGQTA